jgi:hypothetical protein
MTIFGYGRSAFEDRAAFADGYARQGAGRRPTPPAQDYPRHDDLVDSDAKCNPVDSIGSSTESRVFHSEPRLLLGFGGTKTARQ